MKRFRLAGVAVGLSLAAFPLCFAVAQTVVPAPSLAASVPPAGKPEKKVPSPTESRNTADMAVDRRPADPVTPQISVPINKVGQVPPKSVLVPPPRAKPAPSGGIEDSAARC